MVFARGRVQVAISIRCQSISIYLFAGVGKGGVSWNFGEEVDVMEWLFDETRARGGEGGCGVVEGGGEEGDEGGVEDEVGVAGIQGNGLGAEVRHLRWRFFARRERTLLRGRRRQRWWRSWAGGGRDMMCVDGDDGVRGSGWI